MKRSLWVGLFVMQALGCVVIVPPIEHAGGHCEISGSGACATCLRTSCQTSIDACCGDTKCAGDDGHTAILDALDACGGGDAPACAEGLGAGDAKTAAALRSCVTSTCKEACVGDAPVKIDWSCSLARTEDNECATCIYSECATGLDQCCADPSCSRSTDLAGDLGRCTAGDKPGCTYLVTKSDSGFEGKVRACIAKRCGAKCMDDRPHQYCSLQSGGASCSCYDHETSRGPECSVTALGGNCVLGKKGCSCGHYACSADSDGEGCSCAFDGDARSSTKCNALRTGSGPGSGSGRCCLRRGDREFTCECNDNLSSCIASIGEYPVPTCNIEDALVGLANVLVTQCSK